MSMTTTTVHDNYFMFIRKALVDGGLYFES